MTDIDNNGYLFEPKQFISIVGAKRSGKSNLLVLMMYRASIELKWKVYSNMTLKNIPNYIKLDSKTAEIFLSQLNAIVMDKFNRKDFSPVFLGIDEFPNILHAQLWKEGTRWSKTFDQLGKANITCAITATHFNKIYNGVRETSDHRIIIDPINDDFFIARFQKQSAVNDELYKTFYKNIFCTHPMRKYYDTYEGMYI